MIERTRKGREGREGGPHFSRGGRGERGGVLRPTGGPSTKQRARHPIVSANINFGFAIAPKERDEKAQGASPGESNQNAFSPERGETRIRKLLFAVALNC
jgi:hypothetical protein